MFKNALLLVIFYLLFGCAGKPVLASDRSNYYVEPEQAEDVVIVAKKEVTKVIIMVDAVPLFEKPDYCRFYGGMTTGIIGGLFCIPLSIANDLPYVSKEFKRTEKIYEVTLNNDQIVYVRKSFLTNHENSPLPCTAKISPIKKCKDDRSQLKIHEECVLVE